MLGGALGCAVFGQAVAARNSSTQAIDPQAVGQLAPWPAGKPAPGLKVLALDGQTRKLGDYAGSPLILNFWASYCAPCRLEMPQFNQLLHRFRPQGLRVLAVNHGEMPARVLQFLQSMPFEGDVLLDRSQTQLPAWGGIALPTSFVMDAKGQVRLWHMGEIDWLAPSTMSQLQAIFKA